MLIPVILIVLGIIIVFGIAPAAVLSFIIYRTLLVRTDRAKWGRECSLPEDEEYKRMFDIGLEWELRHHESKTEVQIENDGYKLAGEYFDFGYKKAVIIIPGRMESCLYSYYFAEPFLRAGYNVLAIDNRSHGLSDGKISCLGYKEYRDIRSWGEFLHDKKGIESIVLHGICIGSSTALFLLTDKDCPDYFVGMIAEGMYTTFSESFKNHMIEDKRPLFPLYMATMLQIRLISGADVVNDGPVKRIGKLKKPILFLHSKEDIYSLPEKAEILYGKCESRKEIVWFDKGAHSRIRICNTEAFDSAVVSFLERNFA